MSAHGRLEGRVGIVTGAAGGMGAAHVTRLAGEGATVYAADIHPMAGSSRLADTHGGPDSVGASICVRGRRDLCRYGNVTI